MPDPAPQPVVVPENAGTLDTLGAAGRYLVVIVTIVPALLALLQARDIAGVIDFLRGNQGAALIAAVVGFGTLAYGLIKTHKRGSQIATVAADSRVPDRVAKIAD